MMRWRVEKIISGGQTGADRGGLDAAIALGIPDGGWVPKNRRAEDGVIPERYSGLRESKSTNYRDRTRLNIADSDVTICFVLRSNRMTPGTRFTIGAAKWLSKPCLLADADDHAVRSIYTWLAQHKPRILNVAGSRESKAPGIQEAVRDLLIEVLRPKRTKSP